MTGVATREGEEEQRSDERSGVWVHGVRERKNRTGAPCSPGEERKVKKDKKRKESKLYNKKVLSTVVKENNKQRHRKNEKQKKKKDGSSLRGMSKDRE